MIVLNVFCNHPDIGRFSTITIPSSKLSLVSVEQFYNRNIPFKSSVPLGEYELVPINSPKYGETVALFNPDLNVYVGEKDRKNDTDRFACLFHKANRFDELQGCIAPGIDFGWIPINNKSPIFGIRKSKLAFNELLPHLRKQKIIKIQLSDNIVNQNLDL